MNPYNIRQPQDRRKVYNEYLANLQMQIDNLAKTESAVEALKTTGVAPVQPTDTRTLSEKLLDIDNQKKVLRQALLDITDGAEAGKIMKTISDEDVVFLGVAWGDFSKLVKQKFASGILAPLFNEVLQRYKKDYISSLSVQQSGTTEELLLSMREMMRLMPNADQLRELTYVIQQLPTGSVPSGMASSALAATSTLSSLLPTSAMIEALDKMNPIDRAAAQKAINDGLSSITTGAVLQDLTQKLQQAPPPQKASILTTIINDIILTKHDADQLFQANQLAELKKSVYEITKPENISRLERIPTTKATKQIAGTDIETTVFIEDPTVTIGEISKLKLPQLRGWLKIKILEGVAPKATSAEIQKMNKEELLGIIDAYKAGQFKPDIPIEPAPQQKAFKVGPKSKKAPKQVAAATVSASPFATLEYQLGMTNEDFKALDYADKRSILESMEQKRIMLDKLEPEEYERFTKLMNLNDPKDESDLNDIFRELRVRLGLGGKGLIKQSILKDKCKGKSKRITFGGSIASMKPLMMVRPDNIDLDKGIKRETSYMPLGKYVIHKQKLRDNTLLMRTVKGGQIAELPQMSISPKLGKMLNKIINGHGFPSHNDLTEMEDSDKDILYKVFKMSKAEGIESIPKPNKTKDEAEFNRFTILKGQIIAGNNSKELIKEFKTLLVKLIHNDKILRKDGHTILLDLAALGY